MSKTKQEWIAEILPIEWEMFSSVQNIGGQAACQRDPKTFQIMRSSQEMAWSEEVLESYYKDLVKAKNNNRNLMTEKYGWMMESTFPAEFQNNIKPFLPKLNPAVNPLVKEIIAMIVEWSREISHDYPLVAEAGRPMESSSDTPLATSLETYFRGELKTYSARTLKLLLEYLKNQKEAGVNVHKQILENTVLQYGYESLDDAESKLQAKGTSGSSSCNC